MSMMTDPDFQDVVEDFIKESKSIYTQLEDVLDDYEDDPSPSKLEHFGQVIDRVMGAAQTIEAHKTGKLCELGKIVSYKASQVTDQDLLNIVTSVLYDTVEVLIKVLHSIEKERIEKVDNFNVDKFSSRLTWLEGKFKDIKRSSVAIGGADEMDQSSIDKLLEDIGL